MQREPSIESFRSVPGRHCRSVSLTGDLHSPLQSMLSPPLANPEPQFIAATSAAQIVSADQNLNGVDPSAGTVGASVSPASLAQLNRFLDNLLFNILMTAKSTNLSAIRPALAEVLKPRLAKEVISAADEELSEYMGGGEDEELSDFRGGREPAGRFELERSWKLTRLRCMVYTRLGDMEEEDEDEHLQREGLSETDSGPGRFSNYIGHITPAAAIFLTSILEYIGEHALIIAGEAASTRAASGRSSRARDEQPDTIDGDILVVEEMDMEKLALNSTLGRLWRTWRKNVRGPALSRTLSRESMLRRGLFPRGNSRQSSIGTVEEPSLEEISQENASTGEEINPADIPLPLSENDVDEIEVPGFTSQLAIAVQARSFRPRSLFLSGSELASPTSTGSISPVAVRGDSQERRSHSRSRSLPSSPFAQRAPMNLQTSPNHAFSTREEQDQLETMIEDDELRGEAPNPPEIPPRSKQRQDLAGVGEDVESDNSEFLGSAPTSRLHSPRLEIAQVHHIERTSEVNQEETASPTQHTQHQIARPSVVSVSSPVDRRKQEVYDTTQTSYLASTEEEEEEEEQVRSTHQPREDKQVIRTSSNRMDANNVQQKESPRESIVETSFVAQPNKSTFQPPRHAPPQQPPQNSAGTPDQEHPYSSRTQRSGSIRSRQSPSGESDKSGAGTHSQRNPTSSIGGNTTPRYAQPGSAVSTGSERAAVQRVTPPPPSTPRDSSSRPRRSVSIGSHRDKRPKTSGSATSQVSNKLKGLVGWQAGESDRQFPLPTRTSTETTGTLSRFADSAPEPADLDLLIQSDETIHYTLTPRNMREMEDSSSPRWAPTRTDASDMAEIWKQTGPSGAVQQSERRPSATSSKLNGLRIQTSSIVSPHKSKFVESPAVRNSPSQLSPAPKSPPPQARDPRVGRESMRDIAEFIRSTGPDRIATVPENRSLPSGGLSDGSSAPTNRKLSSASGSTSPAMPSPSNLSKELPKRPTQRLEARPALLPNDVGTSELIDFIREGPPQEGSHRIPRSVAPFRTTMDSDEFQYIGPARLNRDNLRQSSAPSTQDGSRSIPSSFNSRTGLLESTNRSNTRMQTQSSQPPPTQQLVSGGGFDINDGAMPTRTRRRVKDPYAIDFDSDDDFEAELQFGGLKAHKEEEESLADFLRNVPPPADFDQPQLLSVNAAAASGSATNRPKSSMRTRLMRATSVDKVPSAKLSRSSLRSHKSNTSSTTPMANAAPLKLSRSNSQINNYPQQSSYASHVERQRNGGPNAPLRPQVNESRSYHRANQTGTADLADFFKNTAPPAEPMGNRSSASSISMEKSNTSSFSRMFSRKKKQAV
ncbi:hypothetical protein FQN51_002257 [Onygenales sp. PD_10]|nr:hypothetical protein FQN51_002257 [Onygenales sp. PD_10]